MKLYELTKIRIVKYTLYIICISVVMLQTNSMNIFYINLLAVNQNNKLFLSDVPIRNNSLHKNKIKLFLKCQPDLLKNKKPKLLT